MVVVISPSVNGRKKKRKEEVEFVMWRVELTIVCVYITFHLSSPGGYDVVVMQDLISMIIV